MIPAGALNRRITFQRPVASPDFDGAGSETWSDVVTVFADVQDVLASQAERLNGVVNLSSRPAKIRLRFRSDITPDMRVKIGNRILQIVAGPAELGRREGIELMAQEYST